MPRAYARIEYILYILYLAIQAHFQNAGGAFEIHTKHEFGALSCEQSSAGLMLILTSNGIQHGTEGLEQEVCDRGLGCGRRRFELHSFIFIPLRDLPGYARLQNAEVGTSD